MKRNVRKMALILMLGASTVAAAQAPDRVERFGNQIRQMQALSSSAPTYADRTVGAAASASRVPVREAFGERLARLQQDASNSSGFDRSTMPTPRFARDRESFADVFARMQASSSNSGEYGLSVGNNARAALATRSPGIGKPKRGRV